MTNNIAASDASTASASDRPLVTRGLRREQEKRRRRRARVPPDTLVLGIDLARERQAASFSHDGQVLGRRRIDCAAHEIDRFFPEAQALATKHGLSHLVVAFEPAGLYWCLAAEACERAGVDYLLVHGLSVKREREITRYTPEKTDPRDADLISFLPPQGKFLETRLSSSVERDALAQLARDYFLIRKLSAAERTRLRNFWNRMLPEFFSVLRDPTSNTALAVAGALSSDSELVALTSRAWSARVRRAAQDERILLSRASSVLPLLKQAHADPVRRSGEGMSARIRHAAQRRRLLEAQKLELRLEILQRYQAFEEHVFLDSIPGADPFYNALVLGIVGDFHLYDDARAIVKLAGSEVNHYASGDWDGTSHISHRGRSRLRAAAYQQARLLVVNNDDYRARFYHLLHRTHRPNLRNLAAYVAVMNSYLRTAHALVTGRQLYAPRLQHSSTEAHHH
jgi:transposase